MFPNTNIITELSQATSIRFMQFCVNSSHYAKQDSKLQKVSILTKVKPLFTPCTDSMNRRLTLVKLKKSLGYDCTHKFFFLHVILKYFIVLNMQERYIFTLIEVYLPGCNWKIVEKIDIFTCLLGVYLLIYCMNFIELGCEWEDEFGSLPHFPPAICSGTGF